MSECVDLSPMVLSFPAATSARAVLEAHLLEAEAMLEVRSSPEETPSTESVALGEYLRFCTQHIIRAGLRKDSSEIIRERLGFFYEETKWHIQRARAEDKPIEFAVQELFTANFKTQGETSVPIEVEVARAGLSRFFTRRQKPSHPKTAAPTVA